MAAQLTKQQSLGLAGKELLVATMGGGGGLAARPDDLTLASSSVRVGLAWDLFPVKTEQLDLDCAALVFDRGGVLVDACYYNNLNCSNGALVHSGDNRDGAGEGFDETIDLDLAALPPSVSSIVLVVTAHSGGSFADVETARVCVAAHAAGAASAGGGGASSEGGAEGEILTDYSISSVPGHKHTALVLAVLHRGGSPGWCFRRVETEAYGVNFNQTMAHVLPVVDAVLPPGARANHTLAVGKTFAMHKADVFKIPKGLFVGGEDMYVGLGWDCSGAVDLDASVIGTDGRGNLAATVYFGSLKAIRGIHHMGDNQTGAGSGDDEKIKIDLDAVPFGVKELVVVVNIYTSQHTFRDVRNAYVRLVSVADGKTLLKYKLEPAACTSSGLVFCKIFRTLDWGWAIQAVGEPCDGRRATDKATLAAAGVVNLTPGRVVADGGVSSLQVSLSAEGLPAMDAMVFGMGPRTSSDPYCVLKRLGPGGARVEVARTEIVMKNLNPCWPTLVVAPAEACGDLDAPVVLEVYDWDRGKADDYIGEVSIEGGLRQLLWDRPQSPQRRSLEIGAGRKNAGKKRGVLLVRIAAIVPANPKDFQVA